MKTYRIVQTQRGFQVQVKEDGWRGLLFGWRITYVYSYFSYHSTLEEARERLEYCKTWDNMPYVVYPNLKNYN